MKTIIHKDCCGIVATCNDDTIVSISQIPANKFKRIDGTKPVSGDNISEKCPSCGRRIKRFEDMDMVIEMDKDVWL